MVPSRYYFGHHVVPKVTRPIKIVVRLTSEEDQAVERVAALRGLSKASLLRLLATDYARDRIKAEETRRDRLGR